MTGRLYELAALGGRKVAWAEWELDLVRKGLPTWDIVRLTRRSENAVHAARRRVRVDATPELEVAGAKTNLTYPRSGLRQ